MSNMMKFIQAYDIQLFSVEDGWTTGLLGCKRLRCSHTYIRTALRILQVFESISILKQLNRHLG